MTRRIRCGSRDADKKSVGLSNHESAVALLEKPWYAVGLVHECACGLAWLKLLLCSIHHCLLAIAACGDGFLVPRNARAEPPADAVVVARRTPMHFVNGA